jgi:GT2 family glycosyltransferase
VGPEAIDIIIPVYKNAALTARCLESIAANLNELSAYDVRLILINDSPAEAEVTAVLAGFAASHGYAEVIENEVNQGFVKTVNRGLRISCRDNRDVILINSDTQTYPGTLTNLVATAYSDPQIAFVSPRSNNASLCSLPHLQAGGSSTPEDAWRSWRWVSRTMPAHHLVPTAVGFYLYIKRAVLASVGLLDTGFGVGYEEENDLILRANKVGFRAALANHAYAFHAGGASFSLTAVNLETHRASNLELMTNRHAEFLPLLRRYESSPHFRAENLLGKAVPSSSGRLKIVFDLSALGCDFNGTNEFSIGVLSGLCRRHGTALDLNIICPENAFRFHGLDAFEPLRRHDPHALANERFAIAVRFGQPFDLGAITQLSELAAMNVYCMLDTIAEDCGYLSITQPLEELWGFVARHANGIGYISKFSERCFESRFPEAANKRKYTRLLPTRLSEYRRNSREAQSRHVMIMGNHFAHKASQATADILSAAFPATQFATLGKETAVNGNVHSYKAGLLSEEQIRSLYDQASVVVLPSYVEGFGLGVVHALAARKVIVARDIPATREILATYRSVSGVFLYQDEPALIAAVKAAMQVPASAVDDSTADGWDDWADGFADFCRGVAAAEDVFSRLVERIRSGDLLEKAARGVKSDLVRARRPAPCRNLRQLISLDGEEFVWAAYATIFARHPDTEGLRHYLSELDAGVSKFTLISRLRESEEGRSKNLPLAGFRRAAIARRVFSSRRSRRSLLER